MLGDADQADHGWKLVILDPSAAACRTKHVQKLQQGTNDSSRVPLLKQLQQQKAMAFWAYRKLHGCHR
jgi:hypothetical protein